MQQDLLDEVLAPSPPKSDLPEVLAPSPLDLACPVPPKVANTGLALTPNLGPHIPHTVTGWGLGRVSRRRGVVSPLASFFMVVFATHLFFLGLSLGPLC